MSQGWTHRWAKVGSTRSRIYDKWFLIIWKIYRKTNFKAVTKYCMILIKSRGKISYENLLQLYEEKYFAHTWSEITPSTDEALWGQRFWWGTWSPLVGWDPPSIFPKYEIFQKVWESIINSKKYESHTSSIRSGTSISGCIHTVTHHSSVHSPTHYHVISCSSTTCMTDGVVTNVEISNLQQTASALFDEIQSMR